VPCRSPLLSIFRFFQRSSIVRAEEIAVPPEPSATSCRPRRRRCGAARRSPAPTPDLPPSRAAPRRDYWRERIAAQERSGLTVGRFCKEQGLTEQSFYLWRKRLREQQPMRFALVETGSATPDARLFQFVSILSRMSATLTQSESELDV